MNGAVPEVGRGGAVVGPRETPGREPGVAAVVGPEAEGPFVTVEPPATSVLPGAPESVAGEVESGGDSGDVSAGDEAEIEDTGSAESPPGAEEQAERMTVTVSAMRSTSPPKWSTLRGSPPTCIFVLMTW